jgi:hypothetical protein
MTPPERRFCPGGGPPQAGRAGLPGGTTWTGPSTGASPGQGSCSSQAASLAAGSCSRATGDIIWPADSTAGDGCSTDPGRDRALACALVAKCSAARSSNSSVECQDSMTALSSAEPGRPINWEVPSRGHLANWVAIRPRDIRAACVRVARVIHPGLPAQLAQRPRRRDILSDGDGELRQPARGPLPPSDNLDRSRAGQHTP